MSLYRKYRSQSFEDVAGQQHVTRTLQNALTTGRVAHAYLFCGPRGTGKTSTARLLAKALNCKFGPPAVPCNECDLCIGIAAGRAMDVVEVDAASETGIDNVREVIINSSRYAPAEGTYKVYIIDEVHDLSKAAFDGLLKTLEEPPPNVVFILATTEIHKVPATIVSRCQRFEFRRGSLEDVRTRVEFVAQREGVSIEPAASTLIARAAQGGWRDALSLLEQVMSYSSDTITSRDVGAVLGAIEDESLAELTREVLSAETLAALQTLDRLLSEGKDIRQLLGNWAEFLRDCLVQQVSQGVNAHSENPPGGLPDGNSAALADFARPLVPMAMEQGMFLLEQTARAERELRWNTQHRLVLELMLFRMTTPSLSIASSPAQPVPSARKAAVSTPPVSSRVSVSTAPAVSMAAAELPAAASTVSGWDDNGGEAPASFPETPSSPDAESSPTRSKTAFSTAPLSQPPTVTFPPSQRQTSGIVPKPGAAHSESVDNSPAQDPTSPPVEPVTLSAIQEKWKALLNRVGSNSRRLQAVLREAQPVSCEAGVLRLQFNKRYHFEAMEELSARRAVESNLSQIFGQPVRITCSLQETEAPRPTVSKGSKRDAKPVTDQDLIELFPGWEIHES